MTEKYTGLLELIKIIETPYSSYNNPMDNCSHYNFHVITEELEAIGGLVTC